MHTVSISLTVRQNQRFIGIDVLEDAVVAEILDG